jgi:hypothetical protein
MPRKRKFDYLPEATKYKILLNAMSMAMSTAENKKSWRTDVYGIAKQYYRILRKSDFDLIKGKTIDEIQKIILNG